MGLNNEYKWDCLQPLILSAHKSNLTYGAGDYGLNHLGDTDCCCGIDNVPVFSNYHKSNFPSLIREIMEKYCISSTNRLRLPNKNIRSLLNSHCRVSGLSNIYEYMRYKWNRPGSESAPDAFLGVSWTGEYDSRGNCIYRYKKNIRRFVRCLIQNQSISMELIIKLRIELNSLRKLGKESINRKTMKLNLLLSITRLTHLMLRIEELGYLMLHGKVLDYIINHWLIGCHS